MCVNACQHGSRLQMPALLFQYPSCLIWLPLLGRGKRDATCPLAGAAPVGQVASPIPYRASETARATIRA